MSLRFSQEEIMRKLCLTLAAAASVLSTGAFTASSHAMTIGVASGLRPAIEETAVFDQVRWNCTHFWNGRYHRQPHCAWFGGYRHDGYRGHFRGHGPRHFNSYGSGHRRHFR
jgi:hypothetical protein